MKTHLKVQKTNFCGTRNETIVIFSTLSKTASGNQSVLLTRNQLPNFVPITQNFPHPVFRKSS